MAERAQVLILNCMKDAGLAVSFERAISRPIKKAGKESQSLMLPGTWQESDRFPDLSRYSHFIISGSEASVVKDNPWEPLLETMLNEIIQQKKPLLGICYGHQFLARALAGGQYVRKSETPEFGWLKIPLSPNSLFAGLNDPVCMVSHYDEVCDLADHGEFTVIASTPRCAVHAFQYRNLPVWGVQFHPEYDIDEADEIFDIIKTSDSSFSGYFFKNPQEDVHREQCERLLLNFLSS